MTRKAASLARWRYSLDSINRPGNVHVVPPMVADPPHLRRPTESYSGHLTHVQVLRQCGWTTLIHACAGLG
jgi:hypothetical protein